jgi:hypothetical protein
MALRISTGLRNKLCGINTTKIVNGLFTSDATSWTASDATLTSAGSGQSGNCLSIAETGDTNPGKAYQDVTTKIGHLYMLSCYFKKGTADAGKFMIGTTADEDSIYDSGALTDAAWAFKQTWFLATATTTRITLQSTDATAGETSFFDTVIMVSQSKSIQDVFYKGFIKIYSGSQPTLATDAPTGTLLCTIYSDGTTTGLTFDDAVSGTLSKAGAETWTGTAGATGTAGWFRLQAAGDSGGSSSTDERLDGAISTSGAELNMSSTSIVATAVQAISTFQITIPAA